MANIQSISSALGYIAAVLVPILTFLWIVIRDSYTILSKKTATLSKEVEIISKDIKPVSKSFFGKVVFKRLKMREATEKAEDIAQRIINSEESPTIIVGIGRGGAIFGSFISYHLHNTPILCIDREYDYQESRKAYPLFDFDFPSYLKKRVLLVAGEIHTSGTMEKFRNHLLKKGAQEIKTCVFYKQNSCPMNIDYVGRTGEEAILMPWQDADSIRDSLNSSEQKRKLKEQQELNPRLSVYLVRHAETDNNAADRFIGKTDANLSRKGIADAEALARHFTVLGDIDQIDSSPSKRCLDTAGFIADALGGKTIIPSDALREMDYGDWENVNRSEIMKNYRQLYRNYKKDPFNFFPANGESPVAVKERVSNFWNNVIMKAASQGGQIVLVTHKTAGRILLNNIIEGKNTSFHEKEFDNASVTKIIIESGEAWIMYENDTSFLPSC